MYYSFLEPVTDTEAARAWGLSLLLIRPAVSSSVLNPTSGMPTPGTSASSRLMPSCPLHRAP